MTDTSHHLWTFQIAGGRPFTIHDQGNPAVAHDGGRTVFQQMLTDEQAVRVRAVIDDHGCRTVTAQQAEPQTDEQRAERLDVLGRGKEDHVWPTAQCPECFWFDVTTEDPCGYVAWPNETVTEAIKSHPDALDAVVECPVYGGGESD